MTNRKFFEEVIAANISEEITAFAKEAIVKLDKKNENRKKSLTPKQKENEQTKAAILEMLATAPQSAKTLADAFGTNTQTITALCLQLVAAKSVTVEKKKFAGSTSKVNVYSLATEPLEEVEETDEEVE